VLFFHMMVVPTLIFSVCGLKAKLPLSTIVTFMVVGGGAGVGLGLGLGVGVGVALVGVGVGFDLVGVGVGAAFVGVGLGFACVGVVPGCVDVGEGVVLVVPRVAVVVLAGEGAFLAVAPPPQPTSTIRKATMQMPHKATRRGK
jgi:hypothetical protein